MKFKSAKCLCLLFIFVPDSLKELRNSLPGNVQSSHTSKFSRGAKLEAFAVVNETAFFPEAGVHNDFNVGPVPSNPIYFEYSG